MIIGLVVAIILVVIISFALVFSNSFKLYAIGTAIIIVSLIFGFKGGMDKDKSKVMIIAIIIGAGFILFPSLGLMNTVFPVGNLTSTSYTQTGIQCDVVNDCPAFLLSNNVTQDNIDKIDFKCEDSKCSFKLKPGITP